jgi:integrase
MPRRLLFAPTWEDVEKLLSVVKRKRDKCIIRLAAFGGLREAEIVGDVRRIKPETVDFEAYLENVREWERIHGTMPPSQKTLIENGRVIIPGLYKQDIDWERKTIIIYGKGWASGKTPPEIVPIDSETLKNMQIILKSKA